MVKDKSNDNYTNNVLLYSSDIYIGHRFFNSFAYQHPWTHYMAKRIFRLTPGIKNYHPATSLFFLYVDKGDNRVYDIPIQCRSIDIYIE